MADQPLFFILTALTMPLAAGWIFLLHSYINNITNTPCLRIIDETVHYDPTFISVIVPARNEETIIGSCLASLLQQRYPNFEVIICDDSSSDGTANVVKRFQVMSPTVKLVEAKEPPSGWLGKTWACHKAALEAKGEWLLFTDADTKFSSNLLSSAVSYVQTHDIDILSLAPFVECPSLSSKLILPVPYALMKTRLPASSVNNPKSRSAYVYGSFFLVRRSIYSYLGGHEAIRDQIIEDKAFGEKAKRLGVRLRLLRGEHALSTLWSRSWVDGWQALVRVLTPFLKQQTVKGIMLSLTVFLLWTLPILGLLTLPAALVQASPLSILPVLSSLISLSMLITYSLIETVSILKLNPLYSLLSPVGAVILSAALLTATYKSWKGKAVRWRGRSIPV